jgi:glycosyltransferase involved in cell wall biosynthesis
VASFEEVKGHKYLIQACRLLWERGIEFACYFVGEGPLRREVEVEIAKAGLSDKINLLGTLPRPEVASLLSRMNVMALASVQTRRGNREGIPVALMEGMASGLPVVASAISGIPELVESGRTGLLVPSRDPVALADALEKLSKDQELRRRLGTAGREKVMREFNLRINAAELRDLLMEEGGIRAHREPQIATALA